MVFRKQEKVQRKSEKEARKIEEKTAKKLEREAAKLEKLYKNSISRSTERVGGQSASGSRSGSLERRRSGDSELIVQSTVHGNDVFFLNYFYYFYFYVRIF